MKTPMPPSSTSPIKGVGLPVSAGVFLVSRPALAPSRVACPRREHVAAHDTI